MGPLTHGASPGPQGLRQPCIRHWVWGILVTDVSEFRLISAYLTMRVEPTPETSCIQLRQRQSALLLLLLLLFSRLYDISTSSCAHLTIILSSSSICLSFQSSSINPFSPISPLTPSVQVSLGLPRFLLPGGLHFMTFLDDDNNNNISKSFQKCVSNIPGKYEVKEIQKTAMLGTAHILRKVLM